MRFKFLFFKKNVAAQVLRIKIDGLQVNRQQMLRCVQQVSYIDGELKTKMASYNMVKSNLINHQRQQRF